MPIEWVPELIDILKQSIIEGSKNDRCLRIKDGVVGWDAKIMLEMPPPELSIDDIKDSTIESLTKIEGIEQDTAKALIERAKEFYEKDQEDISKRIKDLGLENDLINHKGLTPGMLVTLGEQKILTLNDFADLASDELTGGYDIVKGERVRIKGYLEDFALSKKEADDLIMSARDIVYQD